MGQLARVQIRISGLRRILNCLSRFEQCVETALCRFLSEAAQIGEKPWKGVFAKGRGSSVKKGIACWITGTLAFGQ